MKKFEYGKISRRGFLVLAGLGTVGASLPFARKHWQATRRYRHAEGIADDTAFDETIIETVIAFVGSFFGVALDNVDRVDLNQRLAFVVHNDNGWRVEYRVLSKFVDQVATKLGGKTFVQSDEDIRERVIHEIALTRKSRLRNRLHAFASSDGRDFLRMQQSTIPQLQLLYRRSGVPWRHRGYETWPGAAGEMLAYTRKPGTAGL